MDFAGKFLIITGFVLIVIGLFFILGGQSSWLGRLPGDFVIHKKNFSFYFPVTTCVLISIFFSVILFFFFRK